MTLLPWIKSHPHVAPIAGLDQQTCPRCGSTRVRATGTWTVAVYRYRRHTCRDCGGHWRSTYEAKGPSVRSL